MDSAKANSDSLPFASADVVLKVPGENRYLELLRSAVGRVARISGFTYAGIEDFALAVDEAAVLLLEHEPACLRLRMSATDSGKLTAVISVENAERQWPPGHDLSADMRWQVLAALSEDVWLVEGSETGIGLAQTVR